VGRGPPQPMKGSATAHQYPLKTNKPHWPSHQPTPHTPSHHTTTKKTTTKHPERFRCSLSPLHRHHHTVDLPPQIPDPPPHHPKPDSSIHWSTKTTSTPPLQKPPRHHHLHLLSPPNLWPTPSQTHQQEIKHATVQN